MIRLTFLCRSPESRVQDDARQEENAAINQLHDRKGAKNNALLDVPSTIKGPYRYSLKTVNQFAFEVEGKRF